jgi:hypothetical protein
MARDDGAALGEFIAQVLREATGEPEQEKRRRGSRLSGMRGVVLGAGLFAAVQLGAKAAGGSKFKRRLAKAAFKHAAKKPVKAVRGMAS